LLSSQVARAAEAQLKDCPEFLEQPVIVLAGPNCPGGIVGLVASRLVERYGKPAIVFSIPPEGPARGSARSVEGLNITAAIARQKDLLLSYGGHPMAAGLALEPQNIPAFRVRLARTVEQFVGEVPLLPTLQIDAWMELPQVSMELVNALETLAPFGPGNEKLVLAAHDLRVESAAKIGRNRDHLKLTVADPAGVSQTVLWWNGAEEALPAGRFDLAYCLRAADWRGAPELQLELVDFRLIEPAAVEVEASGIEVIDYRHCADPAAVLAELRAQPSLQVWAEAGEKKAVHGLDREELSASDRLAVWTTPASAEAFSQALEKVRPRQVYLFAVTEPAQSPAEFLQRLGGLVNFILNRRGGQAALSALVAAAAQTHTVVRFGLEWLAAQGQIQFTSFGDELTLARGNSSIDPERSARLWQDLQFLLAESAAYRNHFRQAEKDSLLPQL
jgi:single-stranded-DNA-specific exonuclease